MQLIEKQAPVCEKPQRVDQVATQLFPEYSRSRLQQWIKSGALRVDDQVVRSKDKLMGGEQLLLRVELAVETLSLPQKMALSIEYEDAQVIVINKPAGFVVHPGAGNREGTLLNGLLCHHPALVNIPRAGIVHRLDKDTTGLMVVAKTLEAHTSLVKQLQARTIQRDYEAVVRGVMIGGGHVNEPIGRHPTQRTKMAIARPDFGKEALTHYRILKRFTRHTHIRLQLETGRTHQIRVHMAHIGHALVGDATYAGRQRLTKGLSDEIRTYLATFPRQALHAIQLGFNHPQTNEWVEWTTALPDDFNALLAVLRDNETHFFNG